MQMKRVVGILLVLCLVFAQAPVKMHAAENAIGILALGDSISTGFGLANYDKTNLSKASDAYVNRLRAASGVKTVNLSVDSLITERLLTLLESESYQEQIASAEHIILSIGGNNVLEPITTALKVEFGLEPDATPEALEAKFEEVGLFNALGKAKNAVDEAKLGITVGVTAFKTDYPVIIEKIKTLNPEAQLYVSTVYNPFHEVQLGGIDLDGAVSEAIQEISGIIRDSASDSDGKSQYRVIDVEKAFIENGTGERLTNVNVIFASFNLDPHPSKAGHAQIFRLYGRVLFQEIAPELTMADALRDPAKDSIAYLAALGIINGMGDNLYQPDGLLTRAQFVKILYGCVDALTVKEKAAIQFTDLTADWYKTYIDWAYRAGVTEGTGNNRFSPESRISHQDLCTMLYRFLKSNGYVGDAQVAATSTNYSDHGLIAVYAVENIYGLKTLGITFGEDNEPFNPSADTTRAEAAVILAKFLRYITQ